MKWKYLTKSFDSIFQLEKHLNESHDEYVTSQFMGNSYSFNALLRRSDESPSQDGWVRVEELEKALYETRLVLNKMVGMVSYIEHPQKWMMKAEEEAAYILRKYFKIEDTFRSNPIPPSKTE